MKLGAPAGAAVEAAFTFHRVSTAPREWRTVADALRASLPVAPAAGGPRATALYGIWRSQIGRPRDELSVITVGPAGAGKGDATFTGLDGIAGIESRRMQATVRPDSSAPPRRQGNYAFRWFDTSPRHWDAFLELCTRAWPGFESAFDSQVIGLWEVETESPDHRHSLLLTRRPDLAWNSHRLTAADAYLTESAALNRKIVLDVSLIPFGLRLRANFPICPRSSRCRSSPATYASSLVSR